MEIKLDITNRPEDATHWWMDKEFGFRWYKYDREELLEWCEFENDWVVKAQEDIERYKIEPQPILPDQTELLLDVTQPEGATHYKIEPNGYSRGVEINWFQWCEFYKRFKVYCWDGAYDSEMQGWLDYHPKQNLDNLKEVE